jgi:hypothetical protein
MDPRLTTDETEAKLATGADTHAAPAAETQFPAAQDIWQDVDTVFPAVVLYVYPALQPVQADAPAPDHDALPHWVILPVDP